MALSQNGYGPVLLCGLPCSCVVCRALVWAVGCGAYEGYRKPEAHGAHWPQGLKGQPWGPERGLRRGGAEGIFEISKI